MSSEKEEEKKVPVKRLPRKKKPAKPLTAVAKARRKATADRVDQEQLHIQERKPVLKTPVLRRISRQVLITRISSSALRSMGYYAEKELALWVKSMYLHARAHKRMSLKWADLVYAARAANLPYYALPRLQGKKHYTSWVDFATRVYRKS